MAAESVIAPRILFATGSNDPFIESIERHLNTAIGRHGGQLLRVVEARQPAEDDIPTIDLSEAMRLDPQQADLQQDNGVGLRPSEFERIVEDTYWLETTAGQQVERQVVRDRLTQTARHVLYILQTYHPNVVLAWNGLLSQRGVFAAVARQMRIPVCFCERGALPGSWYVDPTGVNGGSSLVETPLVDGLCEMLDGALRPQQRQAIMDQIESMTRAGTSAWGQPPLLGPRAWQETLDIPEGARCLFFPLQVDADTNMRFFSPHFANSLEALRAVADAICEKDDWFLLVKPHPKGNISSDEIERVVGSRGRCVFDINLHDALALAALVVTINSTVATEAAWQNKPVLQLGRGILSGQRIVSEYHPSRPIGDQLELAIQCWHDEPERFERALRFYQFLKADYLLQADEQPDADRLVIRLTATLSESTESTATLPEAAEIAGRFTWAPAVKFFDRWLRRRSGLKAMVLVGYGQNARRLLQSAKLDPDAQKLRFSIWDDTPEVRRQAGAKGLALYDPWTSRCRSADTLLVVTPRRSERLLDRLAACGYAENKDYTSLCPDLNRTL